MITNGVNLNIMIQDNFFLEYVSFIFFSYSIIYNIWVNVIKIYFYKNELSVYKNEDYFCILGVLISLVPLYDFCINSNFFIYNDILNLDLLKESHIINFIRVSVFNEDLFALVLIFLSSFIGILSKIMLSVRERLSISITNLVFSYFNLIIVYFINTDNLLDFFIIYECLLIPSFFLIFFLSYSMRAIQSSLYFLIWTQLGSLLVLIGFIILYYYFKIKTFVDLENMVHKYNNIKNKTYYINSNDIYKIYYITEELINSSKVKKVLEILNNSIGSIYTLNVNRSQFLKQFEIKCLSNSISVEEKWNRVNLKVVDDQRIKKLKLVAILLFLGFGSKIPLWPFQYWITKTHVEAPGGFSVYLSGFLVKTAMYAIYKLIPLICTSLNFQGYFIIISFLLFIGILDSSIKMILQIDIKKLVAYCTIQEMNIIAFIFMFGSSKGLIDIGIIFVISHAFISALLFYLVDIIYQRWQTRNILMLSGILITTPNLGIFIILTIIIFSGIPGTLKFIIEFSIINSFLKDYFFISLFLLLYNLLAILGFSKIWFNIIFGAPAQKNNKNKIILDLNYIEIQIISVLLMLQIIPVFFI